MRNTNTLYPNLVAELARSNMSIGGLADELGMSRGNLYNKMHGAVNFNINDMKRIRKILVLSGKGGDYTLDHLFGE